MRILYLPNSYSQQRQHEKPANIYPVRMAMEAEWYRKQGHDVIWGNECAFYKYFKGCNGEIKIIKQPENLPFLTLPRPDRVFTRAKEYDSGNYKFRPGTHIMSASGCSHGKCVFCVENGKENMVRPVEDVISEIEECRRLGFKEVFDDSATFPMGDWLETFATRLRSTNVSKRPIFFGCNMRICNNIDFNMLHNSNFRMLLFGIESANQITLDKINKGVKVEDIIPTIKRAAAAGLEPHIAGMVGYPWESEEDCLRTVKLFRYLLSRGYAKTAQMSFYCPPVGQEQGNKHHLKHLRGIYYVAFNPILWYNKVIEIRNMADFNYLIRCIKEGCRGICARKRVSE